MASNKMKVITCILCEEPYDLGRHEPVALPACGHTFCRWCLMQMSLENAVLRCPTCRTVHNGPPPEDLARNFALLSCIEDLADNKMKKSPLDTTGKHEKSELKGIKRESSKECSKKENDGKGNGSDSPSDGWNSTWKKVGYGACIATGAIGTVAAAPVVLAGVGFTATGITAGSWAASMMSASAIANGGGVVAGGLVATLQSAGAAGIGATATGALATVGGAVGGGVAALSHKLFGSSGTSDDKGKGNK